MTTPERLARNSFKDFITEEYHAKMTEPDIEAMQAAYEAELKPVTVRLHPDHLKTIDNLASKLDLPRQRILAEMIEGGIDLALTAITEANCWADPLYQAMNDEEKLKRLNMEHTLVVNEYCK